MLGAVLVGVTAVYLSTQAAVIDLSTTTNNAFQAGEKLNYGIVFKGMTVGHGTLAVYEDEPVNGRPTLKLESTSRSTKFFDLFCKVRDLNSSIIDQASLFSLVFHQNLNEGKYHAMRNYHFDYQKRLFQAEETEKEKKTFEGALTAPVHDILSALYYTRTLPLQPGQDLTVPVYRNGKVVDMVVKVAPKTKKIKTPAGTFDCLLIEPLVQGDSIFRSTDGRLLIWMTNDAKKTPVLIEATATVGNVRVRLLEASPAL